MYEKSYDIKRLDHLALVAGFCKEIGLKELVDRRMPKDSHRSHIMIMTSSLMVYAVMEHLIRTELKEKNAYFPDMKKKPTQKTTAK